MKFIAKSQTDSLLQSALHEITKTSSEVRHIGQQAIADMDQHIQHREDFDPMAWDPTSNQLVGHLRSFAHAKKKGHEQISRQAENKFDALSKQHEFPWSKVKELFIHFLEHSRNLVYKDWKIEGDNNINFGMISHRLMPDAKIAIIGDWGTGGSDALALLEQLLTYKEKPDVIVHLGDIYHSCTEYEMKNNFLLPFEKSFDNVGYRVPVYSIPGNHDYYSGGQPFYNLLGEINKVFDASYRQRASYFCLRTSDNSWQFLGGDTGINDPGSVFHVKVPSITPSELLWHRDKFQKFSGKTLFMTHHPLIEVAFPLSHSQNKALNPFNMGMLKQLGSEFGDPDNRIKAKMDVWFWGHDHYFIPFKTIIKQAVPTVGNCTIPKSRLLGGSARETRHIAKKIHKNILYQNLIERDVNGNLILPGYNNKYINHTWCLINLGTKKIKYFQTPAWEEHEQGSSVTRLPKDQKFEFFQENL